ncbi:MAG: NAD(+)/NADH kinase [Actinobacteria bacterium]|uniref:Unannotated protein n=1 Tax=freshwater metagenome TaxID=449393 RepID=A0A6J6P4I1_9ZZZZ|nr:NAD(+)/NADH kinase [Actinomycetota bacterium]
MPPVSRAAVVSHGRTRDVSGALKRLRATAALAGVELLPDDEVDGADLVVVLGGDGTMLRALTRTLDLAIPVIGVNFGRVGFLTSMGPDDLEAGLARAFAGEYRVAELATLDVEIGGTRHVAINDTVVAGSTLGRMIELDYAIRGEPIGSLPCDGLICATPAGSTAYNLSNGGPVLVWGLDAAVLSFVAPHSLHVRPLVIGRGSDLVVRNASPEAQATVLIDGHAVGDLEPGADVSLCIGDRRSRIAMLPEQTFFRRYADVFGAA